MSNTHPSVGQDAPVPDPSKPFSFEIEIPAPKEDVWKALADGAELQRWFPIAARVKPGVGGAVFLSWGPGCEGEAPITIWEPSKRIGWAEKHDNGAVEISASWEIVSSNDANTSTTIRVTQAGFGQGAKWVDYLDSISSGWKFELRSLRHYLTRHRGKDRGCTWLPVPPSRPMTNTEIWSRFWPSAGQGLCNAGSIAGLNEGDPYSLTGPDGKTYSGTVVRHVPNRMFAGTVRELNDALMRIELEPGGCAPDTGFRTFMPMFWLSIWGGTNEQAQSIGAAWQHRMQALLAG